MNQLVLLFIAIALISGVSALGGDGEASNVVWLTLFGSAGAAVYFFWKNRGEGQGSSRGYGPTSNDTGGEDAVAGTRESGFVGYGQSSNASDREVYSNREHS